jgi:hypothetical protein
LADFYRGCKTQLLYQFYNKYREIFHFNKNIIIAAIITGVIDIFIVSFVSVVYSNNYFVISMVSLVTDFAIYNSSFDILYFIDNKKRYINADGSKNKQRLKEDSKKLLTTLGAPDFAYLQQNLLPHT